MSPNPTPQPNSFLIQTVRPRSLSMEQKSKALSKRKKRIPGRGTNVFFHLLIQGLKQQDPMVLLALVALKKNSPELTVRQSIKILLDL